MALTLDRSPLALPPDTPAPVDSPVSCEDAEALSFFRGLAFAVLLNALFWVAVAVALLA